MGIATSVRSFFHMLSLPKPDYEVYCREKRLERYQKYGGRIRHLKLHSFVHYLLIPLMKADLYMSGYRLHVLIDKRIKTDRPTIFCPTHIGGVDIEMAFEAIKKPCWILLGDPRELYKSLDGMMLQMNGWIPLDVLEKEDRTAAKAQMIALLQKGGNLLLFPEGVQNISPNALLGHLFAGAVELAITCGAEIVPMAICRDDKNYYFALGENIRYDECVIENRFQLTSELRDQMATLKWELMEHLPSLHRKDIKDTDYEMFIKSILTMNTEYSLTVEDVIATQYHPKEVTEPTDAYAFIEQLKSGHANAFLFDKRIKGKPFI